MRPILGLLALLASSTAAVPASAIFVSFENAANGLYATGIGASGLPAAGGSVDFHYALMQLPAGCAGSLECQEDAAGGNSFGPSTYVVQGPNGVHPLIAGVWTLANDADSQWIGPRADQTNPVVGGSSFPFVGIFASDAQPYVYRTVFDVSALGLFPETSRIDLAWASDSASAAANASHIRLCGITSFSDPICPGDTVLTNSVNQGPAAADLTAVSIRHGRNGAAFSNGLMALDFVVYNGVVAADGLNPSGLRVAIVSATASTPEPAAAGLGLVACTTLAALRRLGFARAPRRVLR